MGDKIDRPDFSESTRKLLDELASEKAHLDWLRARRKQRFETVRGWMSWLTAAWVLKGLLWDSLIDFVRSHLK